MICTDNVECFAELLSDCNSYLRTDLTNIKIRCYVDSWLSLYHEKRMWNSKLSEKFTSDNRYKAWVDEKPSFQSLLRDHKQGTNVEETNFCLAFGKYETAPASACCIILCLQEGLDLLKSTIEPKKEVYGDLSTEVAETWKLMGSTFLSKGDTEKALRALKKVSTDKDFNMFVDLGVNVLKHKHSRMVGQIFLPESNHYALCINKITASKYCCIYLVTVSHYRMFSSW